jgi:hypothetical protein
MKYEVVIEALTEHARQVTVLADDMEAAAGGTQTKLPSDSLGSVGEQFTALMDQLVTAGNRAIQSGVNAMNATGDGVRDSATMLGQQETDTKSTFGGIDV